MRSRRRYGDDHGMGELLKTLRKGSAFHRVELDREGFSLIRTDTDLVRFDGIVRDLVDHAGNAYVAFPCMDPRHRSHYERVFILPIE